MGPLNTPEEGSSTSFLMKGFFRENEVLATGVLTMDDDDDAEFQQDEKKANTHTIVHRCTFFRCK
jgi:hypothetical protein